jgi:hypothetical protein
MKNKLIYSNQILIGNKFLYAPFIAGKAKRCVNIFNGMSAPANGAGRDTKGS